MTRSKTAPKAALPRLRSLRELVKACRDLGDPPRVAVVRPSDGFVLRAALAARRHGVAEPVLVGDMEATRAKAKALGLDISALRAVDAQNDQEALFAALSLFKSGEVGLLMKGLVSTASLLKAVLDKERGVPPQGILSHLALFRKPGARRLMILTDPGVNIRPNLQRKAEIVRNALSVMRALGVARPRVAVLAAVDTVNFPAMPATLDADLLAKMGQAGEFGEALVAGPMALDVAVSPRSARIKGVDNPVAGRADILVVPDIECGNVLYKSLNTFSRAEMAGIVVGSGVPMVVPSRGDSDRSKLSSLALAAYLAKTKDRGARP